ncbi:hypothetical protein HHI36_018655 [Cryptolaemus montrouzieri]|uniref:Uncharacterized protein n=1 Tax=Cryptolaemus montrouzieri TaxID=559131 RepID=A0ABD2P0R8_9CUCU
MKFSHNFIVVRIGLVEIGHSMLFLFLDILARATYEKEQNRLVELMEECLQELDEFYENQNVYDSEEEEEIDYLEVDNTACSESEQDISDDRRFSCSTRCQNT